MKKKSKRKRKSKIHGKKKTTQAKRNMKSLKIKSLEVKKKNTISLKGFFFLEKKLKWSPKKKGGGEREKKGPVPLTKPDDSYCFLFPLRGRADRIRWLSSEYCEISTKSFNSGRAISGKRLAIRD